MNTEHGRQRIRRPAVLAFGVVSGHLLLQLLPRNQLVHALQKNLTASFALLGLVLCFGEGDLIHGSNESYRFCDGRIIADFGELFRPSLDLSTCITTSRPSRDSGDKRAWLCIFDLNEPLWLHGVEILTDIGWQVTSRIQHKWFTSHALEYNPVPEVLAFFLMVLDRQQCQIGQCLPRFKWGFISGGFDTCTRQHTPDILCI